MNKTIKYLPCSVICHGECELILVKQVQGKRRRNLNPLARDNGKSSILINTINHYLEKHFPDKRTYIKTYRDLLFIDKDTGSIKNHKIFTIMDKDDAPDELFESYMDKSLFNNYWWGKENLIEPIYFNPNMDVVLKNHGIKIDTSKHKPAQYFRLLTTRYDEIISIFNNLSDKESNIKLLFEYLDKINEFEDKTK